jgi:hypothetical protein
MSPSRSAVLALDNAARVGNLGAGPSPRSGTRDVGTLLKDEYAMYGRSGVEDFWACSLFC